MIPPALEVSLVRDYLLVWAKMLADLREFFAERNLLEVQTDDSPKENAAHRFSASFVVFWEIRE